MISVLKCNIVYFPAIINLGDNSGWVRAVKVANIPAEMFFSIGDLIIEVWIIFTLANFWLKQKLK